MGWLIFAVVILLILGLLCLRIRIGIIYDKELILKIKVLFFSYPLFPAKEKRPKIKSFTLKNLNKKKKSSKAKTKQTKKEPKTKKKERKLSELTEMLKTIRELLNIIVLHTKKHLRVELTRIYIKVSGKDAADTAVLYGITAQSTAYIVELLSHYTELRVQKHNSITVEPDFLNQGCEAKLKIVLSMRLWQIISLLLSSLMHLNKLKLIKLPKGQDSTNG